MFMWQSVEILNVFNTLPLKQIFWKTETFLEKLEYRFLVESTKIENAILKWTYHKEPSFGSNYFIFLKISFNYKNMF